LFRFGGCIATRDIVHDRILLYVVRDTIVT
jgi:hypothetical protein